MKTELKGKGKALEPWFPIFANVIKRIAWSKGQIPALNFFASFARKRTKKEVFLYVCLKINVQSCLYAYDYIL